MKAKLKIGPQQFTQFLFWVFLVFPCLQAIAQQGELIARGASITNGYGADKPLILQIKDHLTEQNLSFERLFKENRVLLALDYFSPTQFSPAEGEIEVQIRKLIDKWLNTDGFDYVLVGDLIDLNGLDSDLRSKVQSDRRLRPLTLYDKEFKVAFNSDGVEKINAVLKAIAEENERVRLISMTDFIGRVIDFVEKTQTDLNVFFPKRDVLFPHPNEEGVKLLFNFAIKPAMQSIVNDTVELVDMPFAFGENQEDATVELLTLRDFPQVAKDLPEKTDLTDCIPSNTLERSGCIEKAEIDTASISFADGKLFVTKKIKNRLLWISAEDDEQIWQGDENVPEPIRLKGDVEAFVRNQNEERKGGGFRQNSYRDIRRQKGDDVIIDTAIVIDGGEILPRQLDVDEGFQFLKFEDDHRYFLADQKVWVPASYLANFSLALINMKNLDKEYQHGHYPVDMDVVPNGILKRDGKRVSWKGMLAGCMEAWKGGSLSRFLAPRIDGTGSRALWPVLSSNEPVALQMCYGNSASIRLPEFEKNSEEVLTVLVARSYFAKGPDSDGSPSIVSVWRIPASELEDNPYLILTSRRIILGLEINRR